jgi:hypothetical protein
MKKKFGPFNVLVFIRSLSYREFLTSASLVLLLMAIYVLLSYYSSDLEIGNNTIPIKVTLFLIMMPLAHIVYRMEHNRGNSFIGRTILDCVFILFLGGINTLHRYFWQGYLYMDLDILVTLLATIMIIILVMMFEGIVELLRYVLNLLKWQIL